MTTSSEERPQDSATEALSPILFLFGHRLQQDERHHSWIIDQVFLACTPSEYLCLTLLLERAERCVPLTHFLAQFHERELADPTLRKRARMKVAHLMSKLRAKLWPLGLDIASVVGVGYMLLCAEGAASSDEQKS